MFSCISNLNLVSLLVVLCPRNSLVNAVSDSAVDSALGINCKGSWLCPSEYLTPNYIRIMVEIATGVATCNPRSDFNCGPMNDTDIYAPDVHIICLPQGESFLGGICAFTQGNVASLGTTGVVIKQKLEQLSDHGCHICGSVPLADNNDPDKAGFLSRSSPGVSPLY